MNKNQPQCQFIPMGSFYTDDFMSAAPLRVREFIEVFIGARKSYYGLKALEWPGSKNDKITVKHLSHAMQHKEYLSFSVKIDVESARDVGEDNKLSVKFTYDIQNHQYRVRFDTKCGNDPLCHVAFKSYTYRAHGSEENEIRSLIEALVDVDYFFFERIRPPQKRDLENIDPR